MSSPAVQPLPETARPQLRLEIASNALLLSGVREMVASIAKRLGFSDESCGQLSLAVDEALCNVIRHGYDRQPDRPIWLTLYAHGNGWDRGAVGGGCSLPADGQQPESIRIVIEDEARQVDPSQIKSRDLDEIRPGGLGVHIIRSVMDEVQYEKRNGIGMRLTMVKNRLGPARSLPGGVTSARGSSGIGRREGGCCG